MANLKTYLQSLLDSFINNTETRQLIGHQAYPSNSSPITIFENGSADGWTVFATYTPPADGFVVLTCTSANIINREVSYSLIDRNATPMPLIVPQAGSFTTSTMVRKGETVRFAGDNVANTSARFIPSYGNV